MCHRQVTCSSSLAAASVISSSGVSCPGELGSVYLVCCPGTSGTSPFCLFGLAPSCFLHNLYPSQIGGVPRSGIYAHSKARKNDQRDPGEKRFPSVVLFIILLPLPRVAPPYSTVAPLCIPGHCAFSCTCHSSAVGREESVWRERAYIQGVQAGSVSEYVREQVRACCEFNLKG